MNSNIINLPQYEEYHNKLKAKDKYTTDEDIYIRWYKAYKKATKDRELIDKSY